MVLIPNTTGVEVLVLILLVDVVQSRETRSRIPLRSIVAFNDKAENSLVIKHYVWHVT